MLLSLSFVFLFPPLFMILCFLDWSIELALIQANFLKIHKGISFRMQEFEAISCYVAEEIIF